MLFLVEASNPMSNSMFHFWQKVKRQVVLSKNLVGTSDFVEALARRNLGKLEFLFVECFVEE